MSKKHSEAERKFYVGSFSKEYLTLENVMWRKAAFLPSDTELLVRRVRTEIAYPDFALASDIALTRDPPQSLEKAWHAFYDIKERDKNGSWQSQTEETRDFSLEEAWKIFGRGHPWVTKVRHTIPHREQILELDIFTKPALQELVIAEIELSDPRDQVSRPAWITDWAEVTEDPRFQNVNLANIKSSDELRRLLDEYQTNS